jgi:enterochelin esterase-like enzyme
VKERFWSPALGQKRTYYVYTPPGYAAAVAHGTRFPVLYLLHGSPGQPIHFINIARAGVSLDEGLKAHRLKPFLLVMPSGSDGTFRKDTEWANSPHGNYEGLVLDVVHNVDQRFPTKRGRAFRALGGNSEGGYAGVNIALRHPRTFAIAESWSGYLWEGHHGVFKHATDAVIAANDPERYIPALGPQLKRFPLHAYIYKATREPPSVKNRARAVADELRAVGGHVTFRIFHGGHDWRLWRAQTPRMLAYASRWFGVKR